MAPNLRALAISLLACIFLMGCSSNEKEDIDPSPKASLASGQCSDEELAGGSAWIAGQLKAFGDSDAKSAYSFASEQFRSGVSLDEFASIISGQYSALLNLESFEIAECVAIDGAFVFQVNIVDKQGERFSMQYLLSLIENQWGVDAATISTGESKPTL
jgi:hypothetical protein